MAPYITFRDIDSEGVLHYYILQRDFPHYLGKICNYPSGNHFMEMRVIGYNLWISFSGVLRGNFIPSYVTKEELYSIYNNMANWYYHNRIVKNEKKYNKFKS